MTRLTDITGMQVSESVRKMNPHIFGGGASPINEEGKKVKRAPKKSGKNLEPLPEDEGRKIDQAVQRVNEMAVLQPRQCGKTAITQEQLEEADPVEWNNDVGTTEDSGAQITYSPSMITFEKGSTLADHVIKQAKENSPFRDFFLKQGIRFTIPGKVPGKPRMTRADVWKKRPCVVRYRAFCDFARWCAPAELPVRPVRLKLKVFVAMPKSWSRKKAAAMCGQFHQQRCDVDNMAKSVMDALWKEDSTIAVLEVEKRWAEKSGECVQVEVFSS